MRKFVATHVLERVISIHSIRLLFVFNSPLECLGVSLCLWAPSFRTRNLVVTHLFWLFIFSFSVLYAYAKVCSRSCFRMSNIHTLHSLVICVRRLSVLGPSFRTRNLVVTHLFWLFISSFSVLYAYAKVCSRSCFRTSNIHTLHSLVICVHRLSVLGFCYVCGRLFFRTSNIHTPFCLFICDGSSRAVSDRRGPRQLGDPSRIVTIRQLFGVHYLKFTSAIPFRDMTSGMTVENDS